MHKNRIVSSFMLVMFLFAIAFGAGAPQTFAAGTNLTDVNGNWAQSQIENLAGKGIISGYTDNTFKPANNITRAEFMVIVNRAFSYTNSASVSFKDVKSTDWFAGEVAKASAAGYISGYQDGTMKPNQNITRQEVASIMTRILKLDTSNSTVTFKDAKDIPAWSVNAVAAMAKAGLIKGYPDGTFKAINPITRGEVAAIVYSAISTDTATATVYSQAG
ncbi:MAG: S-layer homology domain-containing protein, partial [Syntrophomonas sp.]